MRYRISAILLAMTVSATGLAAGVQFAYFADVVLLLIVLFLWTVAGFSLGWTTSHWPVQWFNRWLLAAAAALTNWSFLFFLRMARYQAWDEDAHVHQTPKRLTDLLTVLLDMNVAYWWCAGMTVLLAFAAWRRHNQLILAGLGISLAGWLVVGWWALVLACER